MDEPRRKSGGIATMHGPQKQWGHAEWLLSPPKDGKPLLYPAGATNPALGGAAGVGCPACVITCIYILFSAA